MTEFFVDKMLNFPGVDRVYEIVEAIVLVLKEAYLIIYRPYLIILADVVPY